MSDDLWSSLIERAREPHRSGADVWAHLGAQLSPERWRPRLADDVETVDLDWVRSGPRVLLARGSVIVSVDERDARLLSLLDGRRTLAEIVSGDGRDRDLEPARVLSALELLRVHGLLADRTVDVGRELGAALRPATWRGRLSGSVRTLSAEWTGADRFVRSLYGLGLRRVATPAAAAISAVVGLGGLAAFVAVALSHRFSFGTQSPGWGFVLFVALNVGLVFVHELGHALAVVHYGRRIDGAGMRLYYGSPSFFVDAPQALLLTRRQRISQAAAGPWFEFVAGGAAALALAADPRGPGAHVLYRFVVLTYFLLLVNLVPLLELDGYWIFSDVVGVSDLRARSLAFLRHTAWRKVRRRERFGPTEIALATYALVGGAFAVFVLTVAAQFWRRTFGAVASSMWRAGVVDRVLLVVLVAVLAGPLVQVAVGVGVRGGARLSSFTRRARFRMERGWRVEAARTIDSPSLFEDLPVEVLNDLAGRVRLVARPPGGDVVRQGEPADAYFVVRRGRAEVLDVDALTGETRTLGEIGPGQGFGELGLVRHAVRAATVRALTPLELFEVDRSSFERLLAPYLRAPSIGVTLQEVAELAAVPLLARLSRDEVVALAEGGEAITAVPGEAIVTEGDSADGLYVLLEGHVEVVRGGRQVATLGPASYFGEIALLEGGARTATVRATTSVRAFRVSPAGFAAVLATSLRLGSGTTAALPEDRRH